MTNQRISSSPPFMIAGPGARSALRSSSPHPRVPQVEAEDADVSPRRILSEPAAPRLQLQATKRLDRTGLTHIASVEEVVELLVISRRGLRCAVNGLRLQRHQLR
jgi:hypothetical protein